MPTAPIEVIASTRSPAASKTGAVLGVEALPGSPDDMARFVKAERERWGRLIRDNKIQLD